MNQYKTSAMLSGNYRPVIKKKESSLSHKQENTSMNQFKNTFRQL